ncbi:S49 family peptidase [Mongoliitalea lutea]|uniref:Peptidase S49 domain-containing protein n=1 Tax=Mongoliitalea lutea TaxID=849756 RepID=A0A8J3D094_9BACT|nr:S49 family peptidase [Mongoliitalea lutea]GHB44486.1 hypothetical protein GCM10008106_26950 [Mongoliitalea lutea]
MKKLAANWPYLLISQIVKGKFFLHPTIALSLGPQVSRLLSEENFHGLPTKRSLHLHAVKPTGEKVQMIFDDYEDDDEEEGSRDRKYSMYDDVPEGSVAIIPIKGSMMKYGSLCEYGATELADFILEAGAHKNIGSIVLDIDSGGGAVDAVAPLVQAVERVKKLYKKPVVASVDMACSAAYWVASVCDNIIADNNISSEVGSIGVMMSFTDVRGYWEDKGVKFHSIYSNESTDKNLAFQQALDGDYDLIKESQLDPLARAFQNAIKDNRKGKLKESTPGVLSGKTFFGDEAKAIGLIDQVGDNMRAVEFALSLSHARKSIYNL